MARAEIKGQPAAPGIAVGPLVRLPGTLVAARAAGEPAEEAAALERAIAAAAADLTALAEQSGGEAAEIIEFQVAMLEDEALRAPALEAITAGTPAEQAWAEALAAQVADYEAAEDAYFRARSADLRDLAERVLHHLGAAAAAPERAPPGAILLGENLAPSRFLETDWRGGGGIALTGGSPASHVAMLARARGVPMVVGLGTLPDDLPNEAAVDGTAGVLLLAPDAADHARLQSRARQDAAASAAATELLHLPATTAVGRRIAVMLNVAHPSELDALDPAVCDGIGLTRTELLFAGGLPDEETQLRAYRRIVEWAAGRPVTIRTLDAGGDKPIPGLTVAGESNPFLGLRGVRLSLARPDIFLVQLRALARAAVAGPLKVMVPMVTVPGELEAARALLGRAIAELEAAGIPAARPPLGMMVEVPAAALAITRFRADFFSIGSNDLTQYITASARDIGAVAPLADLRNPAVLRLIAEVAAHGKAVGREVSVCGDAAGDPSLVPLLLDAGIESLSMAPNAVGPVKAAIARHH
jgi:phosphotransferase system enzyme I (PtsI)